MMCDYNYWRPYEEYVGRNFGLDRWSMQYKEMKCERVPDWCVVTTLGGSDPVILDGKAVNEAIVARFGDDSTYAPVFEPGQVYT